MSNLLYSKNEIVASIKKHFSTYFSSLPRPTQENLLLLIIGMYAMESFDSVRSCFTHLLKKASNKSLNAYYRTLDTVSLEPMDFIRNTAAIALSLIPEALAKEPVFLCTDDTLIPKDGTKFEFVGKLHDHAMHTGKLYVNGHNFVSLMLCIPVCINNNGHQMKIRYIPIPLGYQMKTDDNTKLELVADMIDNIMVLMADKQVIFSFDCWFAKRPFITRIQQHKNIGIICNARIDSALYELPPYQKTGKRGRPKNHGDQLDTYDDKDFDFNHHKDGYRVAHRTVIAKIFNMQEVHAYVTKTTSNSRRLFLCTINPCDIHMGCAWQENFLMRNIGSTDMELYPLTLYRLRWNIEVGYYEQKTFWSLGKYMVRSKHSIETLLNLINVAYAAMRILPHKNNVSKDFRDSAPQEIRLFLSEQVITQLFLVRIGQKAMKLKNAESFLSSLYKLVNQLSYAA